MCCKLPRWRLVRIVCVVALFFMPGNETLASDDLREQVLTILAALDDQTLPVASQLALYSDDIVLLAPDAPAVRGTEALRAHLTAFAGNTGLTIRHELRHLDITADVVIAEGGVIGEVASQDDAPPYRFATHNLIVFKRHSDDSLTIWKVIYNAAPLPANSDDD
ncbi:MAG: nuclear transport factor 2 family protein [Pseudomonadota bacterium]